MSFDGFRQDSDDFGIIMTGTGGIGERSAISSPFFTVFRCCCGRRAGAAPGEVEAGLARIGPIGRPIEGYLLTDCLRPQARSTRRAGWYCKRAISTLHGSIYRSLRCQRRGAGWLGWCGAGRAGWCAAGRAGAAGVTFACDFGVFSSRFGSIARSGGSWLRGLPVCLCCCSLQFR